jgi:hypothetical protein
VCVTTLRAWVARRRLIRRSELWFATWLHGTPLHLTCVPAFEEAISGEWARTAQDECKQTREVEHVDFHAGRAELRSRRGDRDEFDRVESVVPVHGQHRHNKDAANGTLATEMNAPSTTTNPPTSSTTIVSHAMT